jgi:hypothetical protein
LQVRVTLPARPFSNEGFCQEIGCSQEWSMTRGSFACILLGTLLADPSHAGSSLPSVEGTDWRQVRADCQRLFKEMEKLKFPLPVDTAKALSRLLETEPTDPEAAAAQVQKLLDPLCLAGININPESRVKAARGSLPAELVRDRETTMLIKVHNEGGVTHGLAVSGPQVRTGKNDEGERWLEVKVVGRKLSGSRLEYVLVLLTAHEAGKREATLKFDVGQGTQDLGFRAEVPILFTIKAP